MSHRLPQVLTAIIPVVSGVIIDLTDCGSILHDSGSMSAKTGLIPCHSTAWGIAANVNDGTTISPLSSRAFITISRAVVPLHTVMQFFTPRYSDNILSKSL